MRTTLATDDDVLSKARAVAERDGRPIGQVVSEWARDGMTRELRTTRSRNGFPVLPRRGTMVTLELVNALRDDE
jgi:hypothetical protein